MVLFKEGDVSDASDSLNIIGDASPLVLVATAAFLLCFPYSYSNQCVGCTSDVHCAGNTCCKADSTCSSEC